MKRLEIRDAPEATIAEFERVRQMLSLPRGEFLRRLLILRNESATRLPNFTADAALNQPPGLYKDPPDATSHAVLKETPDDH